MRLNHGSLERDDPRQRLRVNIERIIKGIKGKAVGKIAWPGSDKHPERVISQILLEIEGRGCRTVKTKDGLNKQGGAWKGLSYDNTDRGIAEGVREYATKGLLNEGVFKG